MCILVQCGAAFTTVLTGLPVFGLVASSCFSGTYTASTKTVGELETLGILFAQGVWTEGLRICFYFFTQNLACNPMLLKQFEMMLSLGENEPTSVETVALKCAALAEMGRDVTPNELFWMTRKGVDVDLMKFAMKLVVSTFRWPNVRLLRTHGRSVGKSWQKMADLF